MGGLSLPFVQFEIASAQPTLEPTITIKSSESADPNPNVESESDSAVIIVVLCCALILCVVWYLRKKMRLKKANSNAKEVQMSAGATPSRADTNGHGQEYEVAEVQIVE